MSDVRLRVDDVWKRFSLKGLSLRSAFSRMLGRTSAEAPFWALRAVSFEVEAGETFGIIGANGAGKSTLLKILAGVLPPTRGRLEVCRRVAPLIEVGAGFHPELSGRENIFLNASIMGMTRREIERRFDSIVAFSGLESFLDLAVKHYSSGMYMRLGFSVAVHLEPELLLVDEVLAVGDQAFQHQCLQRIDEMRAQGTAVVLVSHNLFTITGACQRALLLDHGECVASGTSEDVVKQYEARVRAQEMERFKSAATPVSAPASSTRIVSATLASPQVCSGDDVVVRVRVSAPTRLTRPGLTVALTRADGVVAGASDSRLEGPTIDELEGEVELELVLPRLRLVPGGYRLDIAVSDRELTREYDRRQVYFEVSSPVANLDPRFYGSFLLDHHWRTISRSQPRA